MCGFFGSGAGMATARGHAADWPEQEHHLCPDEIRCLPVARASGQAPSDGLPRKSTRGSWRGLRGGVRCMIRPDTTAAKGGAMALIQCPDCGSSVSDAAPACPKCARPIAAAAPMPRTAVPPQKKTGVSAGFTLLVLLALGSWIY